MRTLLQFSAPLPIYPADSYSTIWKRECWKRTPDDRFDEIAIWDNYIPTEAELFADWNNGLDAPYPW